MHPRQFCASGGEDGVEGVELLEPQFAAWLGTTDLFQFFILEWMHRRGSDARNKQEIPPWNHLAFGNIRLSRPTPRRSSETRARASFHPWSLSVSDGFDGVRKRKRDNPANDSRAFDNSRGIILRCLLSQAKDGTWGRFFSWSPLVTVVGRTQLT